MNSVQITSSTIRQHNKTNQSTPKPFQCHVCGKRFVKDGKSLAKCRESHKEPEQVPNDKSLVPCNTDTGILNDGISSNTVVSIAKSKFVHYKKHRKGTPKKEIQKEIQQRTKYWDENFSINNQFYYWFVKACNPVPGDDVHQVARRSMKPTRLKLFKGHATNFFPGVTRGHDYIFLLANCWILEDIHRSTRLEQPSLITAKYTIEQALLHNNNQSITTLELLRSVIGEIGVLVQQPVCEEQDELFIAGCYDVLIARNQIDIRPIQKNWRSHYQSSCYWGRELFVHQVASYALSP